jgi:hypothetical protein
MEFSTKELKLRPHHLLCTQGYSGKGYSNDFVSNMTIVTNYLRNNENSSFTLTFSTDDICVYCPKKICDGKCKDDDKVLLYDKKVIDYFSLEEKEYDYKEITSKINSKMTSEMMDDICSTCCWYKISACKKNIVQAK